MLNDLIKDGTELHDAAVTGDAEGVRRLLEEGADVNARTFYDTTPLMDACQGDKAHFRKFMQEQEEKKAKGGEEPKATPFDLKNFPGFDLKEMIAERDNNAQKRRERMDAPVEDDPEAARALLQFRADVNAVDKQGHSALMQAVMAGRVETARLLLEHKADLHTADNEGRTPLMLAARERKLEAVRLLLERGADADDRTPQGDTTLMMAAEGGRVEIARLLIGRGQDINTVNVNGVTALQKAAAEQHEEMIEFLKGQGARIGLPEAVLLADTALAQSVIIPDEAERASNWGQFALYWSVRRGRIDLVRLFLERGVNIKKMGPKALMQAVKRGDTDCARLLLEAGADVNGDTERYLKISGLLESIGTRPLAWAANRGNIEMVDLLLAHGANVNIARPDGETPLGGAVMFGQLETARRLLEAGADPNTNAMNRMPLLQFATVRKNKEMVRLLLDFGATPERGAARNAVYMAKGEPEIAAMLKQAAGIDLHDLAKEGKTDELLARLEAGADINARDDTERTLLMAALQGKQFETARALIARGADIHTVNRFQRTALHFAVGAGDVEMMRLLIAMGADVLAGDMNGRPPLHFAALGGSMELASLLIEAGARVGTVEAALLGDLQTLRNLLNNGADVNAPDGGGMTPLMAAAARGHNELITVLLTRHADINATQEDGKTALSLAVWHKRLDTVRLLLDKGADVDRAGVDQNTVRRLQKRADGSDTDALKHFEGWEQTPGMTSLACAAVLGDVEYARLLLEHGADINAKSGLTKRSVLEWAVMTDRTEMVRFLLDNGADPHARTRHSGNLLQLAKQVGKNEEIIALLREHLAKKANDEKGTAS